MSQRSHIYYANDATSEAILLSQKYMSQSHINNLGEYAAKLHGRNAFQVLGNDLKTPSSFLLCWTQDSCEHHNQRQYSTGGTGTAISIASMNNIPVFNLQRHAAINDFKKFYINLVNSK